MAVIEDRWFRDGPDGEKLPTSRNGVGLRWRVRYSTPEGRERGKSFARKVDAERFVVGIEASKLQGTFVDPSRGRLTFAELAELWLKSKARIKASTRDRYRTALEDHVLPRWGPVRIGAIENEKVQDWIGELVAAGMSPAHVQTQHFVLNTALQYGVKTRRLTANAARGVELPRVVRAEKRYLEVPVVEAMAAAAGRVPDGRPKRPADAKRPTYRVAVLLLAYCGPRWSEFAALRKKRFDLERRRFRVAEAVVELNDGTLVWGTPKGHEARWVPIPAFLIADLRILLEPLKADDLVFTTATGQVMRNRNARRDWFDDAAIAAGVEGLTPHELRHTAASLAVSAGANILALARMLGHDPAMTLRVYADLFDDDLDQVAVRLDELRERRLTGPRPAPASRPQARGARQKRRSPRVTGAA